LLPLNSTRKCKFYIAGGREKVSNNIAARLSAQQGKPPRGKIANSDREIRQVEPDLNFVAYSLKIPA
jgi:hypothetical protein